MNRKPTYDELEQRIKELKEEAVKSKRVEEKLEQERKRMEIILSALDTGLSLINPDMTIAWVNQKIRKMFPGREPVGQLCHVFYESRETICDGCQTQLSFMSGKICENEQLVPATGKWYYIIAQPIKDRAGHVVNVLEGITDVTERKRAEEAQGKMQAQLSNAVEMAHLGPWEYDVANDLFTFNDHFYKIFRTTAKQVGGYTMSSAEYARRFVHPDDMSVVGEEIRKAIEATDPNFNQKLEHRIFYADGTVGHTTVRFFIVKDAHGRTIKTYGVNQDITDRKRAEETLQESEERYRGLFESVSDAIMVFDAETLQFEDANRATLDLYGYSREEFLSLSVRDISAEQDKTIETVERIKTGEPETIPLRYQRKRNGAVFAVEISSGIFYSGGRKKIIGAVRDITERLRAEEELRESEERFRNTFEQAAVGIAHVLPDGRFVRINQRFCDIVGYTQEEMIEHTFQNITYKDDLETDLDYVSQMLRDELKTYSMEKRYHKKDGSIIWVNLTVSLVRDPSGEPKYFISVVEDITERKRTDEEKKRLEARLQQAYRMEAIGTLAGGIAHDFNNILSAIIGFSEIAISDVERGTSVQKSLSEVLKAGDRAKNLVSQILTFSRQTEHESKPVQVKSITNEALKLLRASLPATIEIRNYLQSQSAVMADPTQIHQIVMNLCTNASHAMHEKGGSLEVRLDDVKLGKENAAMHPEVASGSYIKLTVSDTGQGMEPHVLERIFDPFFTTKEKGEGTGMGLSVVHGIVKSGGGSIFVQSEPGKGTCFEILFPIFETVPTPGVIIEESIPTGTERVLCIDDEKAITDLTKKQLESLGYEVTTRTSPIEALELFELQPDRFDIVITDMTMPKMTGKELSENLLRIKPGMPIILCTGFSTNIDEDQAASMGIKAMIFKPILKRDIAQTIRKVLDEK